MESADSPDPRSSDAVDVLVVGAGILGIDQLYQIREAGFSVQLVEAGDGLGGTWFWNRYPGARFDSESYTYGYLFSEELFDEWRWQEHFAGQPEIERYLNYTVDKFDLRRHMEFGARVTSAVFDETTARWTVHTSAGTVHRPQYLIAATGVLSIPYFPDIPNREVFKGEAYHTGLWPKHDVDFKGKRVAVIGTGSSGVQVVPAILDDVESQTVYQRTPNWCTPLNNRPITPEEQEELRANFESIRNTLNTSQGGFLHVPHDRATFDDTREERWAFYEKIWNSPGFSKLSCNYTDMLQNVAANEEWCTFMAEKIRSIVEDPETADKLIPKDHRYAQKRPPFVTGYFEAFNSPKISLVELKKTPIVRVTETGIETTDGHREFDIIVWATGFDFGTGALNRMGIRGRDDLPLRKYWAEGPVTYLGLQCANFPNLFFPGGPHGAAGNNPRYGNDQTQFITNLLVYARDQGYDMVEVSKAGEQEWSGMVEEFAQFSPFSDASYFFGTNVPGKPRRFLLNPMGRPKLLEMMADTVANDYKVMELSRASATTV
jgi:cation diffusion facilitator CzcD-associated flavoprotein CzcO